MSAAMQNQSTLKPGRPVPKLTYDEMHFAMLTGLATNSGRMSFDDVDTTSGPGLVLVASDIAPPNRATAFAILDSFTHEPRKGGAALFRVFVIAQKVLADDRTYEWLRARKREDRDSYPPLIEAIATLPISFANRNIDQQFLRPLLAEQYKRRPAQEFADVFKTRFTSKGHPKAGTLDFTLDFPSSWRWKEGDRPHVVQNFLASGRPGAATELITVIDLAEDPDFAALPPDTKLDLTKDDVATMLRKARPSSTCK
jgi:hypothetical protein